MSDGVRVGVLSAVLGAVGGGASLFGVLLSVLSGGVQRGGLVGCISQSVGVVVVEGVLVLTIGGGYVEGGRAWLRGVVRRSVSKRVLLRECVFL